MSKRNKLHPTYKYGGHMPMRVPYSSSNGFIMDHRRHGFTVDERSLGSINPTGGMRGDPSSGDACTAEAGTSGKNGFNRECFTRLNSVFGRRFGAYQADHWDSGFNPDRFKSLNSLVKCGTETIEDPNTNEDITISPCGEHVAFFKASDGKEILHFYPKVAAGLYRSKADPEVNTSFFPELTDCNKYPYACYQWRWQVNQDLYEFAGNFDKIQIASEGDLDNCRTQGPTWSNTNPPQYSPERRGHPDYVTRWNCKSSVSESLREDGESNTAFQAGKDNLGYHNKHLDYVFTSMANTRKIIQHFYWDSSGPDSNLVAFVDLVMLSILQERTYVAKVLGIPLLYAGYEDDGVTPKSENLALKTGRLSIPAMEVYFGIRESAAQPGLNIENCENIVEILYLWAMDYDAIQGNPTLSSIMAALQFVNLKRGRGRYQGGTNSAELRSYIQGKRAAEQLNIASKYLDMPSLRSLDLSPLPSKARAALDRRARKKLNPKVGIPAWLKLLGGGIITLGGIGLLVNFIQEKNKSKK